MTTHLYRLVLLAACLLVRCGGGSDEYEPPRLPPPPPPPAPTVEAAPLPEPYSQATPDVSAPSDSQQAATPALAPPPPRSAGATPPPPPSAGAAVAPAPPAEQSQLVYSYPTGQWVYLSGQGWVWVPSGAAALETDGVPYVYLYTPAYGWTWYVSPWGWGPYRYGLWVRHPWHPGGLHGYWVAHPRVVVRLGGRGHFRR